MDKSVTIFVCMRNRVEHFDMTQQDFVGVEERFSQLQFRYFDSRTMMVEQLAEADYVITWNFQKEWYQLAPNLKAIFTPAAGNDWVVEDPSDRVKVFYGAFHGVMIAESLLGMMYMFNSQYLDMEQQRLAKNWNNTLHNNRTLLSNQHVLIIGYGSIGRYCGKLLKAVGCQVTGIKRSVKQEYDEIGVELAEFNVLDAKLAEADHVVLAIPGNNETAGLIHAEHFNKMKSTAYLYNFGRGIVVNEADLIQALDNGEIAGAGLDVFETEPLPESSSLWTMPNVFITPHSSCFYKDYTRLFLEEVVVRLQEQFQNRDC